MARQKKIKKDDAMSSSIQIGSSKGIWLYQFINFLVIGAIWFVETRIEAAESAGLLKNGWRGEQFWNFYEKSFNILLLLCVVSLVWNICSHIAAEISDERQEANDMPHSGKFALISMTWAMLFWLGLLFYFGDYYLGEVETENDLLLPSAFAWKIVLGIFVIPAGFMTLLFFSELLGIKSRVDHRKEKSRNPKKAKRMPDVRQKTEIIRMNQQNKKVRPLKLSKTTGSKNASSEDQERARLIEESADVIALNFARPKGKFARVDSLKKNMKILKRLATELKRKENENIRINIEGHADCEEGERENVRLGIEQAEIVRDFLLKEGIEIDRMDAVSLGDSLPIRDNSARVDRKKNNRVLIMLFRG